MANEDRWSLLSANQVLLGVAEKHCLRLVNDKAGLVADGLQSELDD